MARSHFQQDGFGLKVNGSGPEAGGPTPHENGFGPEAFSNKLLPTEFVLRGGLLSEPVLLTNLGVIGGKAFFRFSHQKLISSGS